MRSAHSGLIRQNSVALILCLTALIILMASALSVSPSSSEIPASGAPAARGGLPAPPEKRAKSSIGAVGDLLARSRFASAVSPASPAGPTITATKTDNRPSVDPANANPGDTIMYTVVISNTGMADATGVTFSDTIDPNTTLVGGTLNSSPIANNDTYTASGNIPISIAAPGVLTNDIDPDTNNNTALTVTQVQGSGANVGVATNTNATGIGSVHGSVTLNSNGSFTYEPPPGFTGNDTFTYQISDAGSKTDTGTVTITISGMVWF